MLERDLLGLKPDPQVLRSHQRQAFANKAADEQENIAKAQHAVEEQKVAALQAQLNVFKFDAGQIDGDGKPIKKEEEPKEDDKGGDDKKGDAKADKGGDDKKGDAKEKAKK